MEATSKQAVADQLKARGLIVVDISDKHGSKELNLEFMQRVKAKDLTIMTRQLATMVSSGMTLLRALYVLENQTDSKMLKETLVAVRKDVEAGLLLSDALERHPKVFTPLYVAMVRAGETGGVLEESSLRTADQLEKDDSLRRQIRAAMMYPAVIITFAMIVLLALVAFLVPIFAKVFEQFDAKLPALTQFTVGLSHIVTQQWYLMLAVVVIVVVAFRQWKRSSWGRPQWDRFRLRIPFKIGDVVQKVSLARWSRTLSTLVSSGVPILQAIEITGKTAGNSVVERSMEAVIESVKGGDDRRAAQAGARVPADGGLHGRRRRGDRRARPHARQGRGLLRGRGRGRRQGADLDPRAGDDHPRRRHRRVHRRVDVPAALQGLRQHQVGPLEGVTHAQHA